MLASALERTARPRRTRTRSRNVNGRPPLAISTLKPHLYDLRPACASLVCPDCKTWVPITGLQTRKPKVVPHDTGRAGKAPAIRCGLGSNRLITVDVRVAKWEGRMVDGHAETAHRRRTTVRRKPKVEQAPAVTQIAAQRQAPADAEPGNDRPSWLLRRKQWASTSAAVRETDTRRAQRPAGDAPSEGLTVPVTAPAASSSPEIATRRPIEVTTRRNVMDRQKIIDRAIEALETGKATPPDGQDPHAHAEMLRTAYSRGGLGGYAAFKAAQRIVAT